MLEEDNEEDEDVVDVVKAQHVIVFLEDAEVLAC
jgi:hypothetical protein